MSQRFFMGTPPDQGYATLEGSEAHHLIHVMRCRVGDDVILFDGQGAEYGAKIAQIGRSAVQLAVSSKQMIDRELACSLHLGVALPKGDRQRWLVEKAVELGVTRLIPLVTKRGVAQPTDSALERLYRAGIEAAKQCGRNRLMEIVAPMELATFCCQASPDQPRWLAHVQGRSLADLVFPISCTAIHVAIGPEGGFTDQEVELAVGSGWQAVQLGPRILRVETAALALAAYVATACEKRA